MSMIAAAIIAGGASLAGAGIAAATRPGAPDAPDYGRMTREGFEAEADWMPRLKEIEALARVGGELLNEGYTSRRVASGDEGYASETIRLEGALKDANQRLADAQKVVDGGPGRRDMRDVGSRATLRNYEKAQEDITAIQQEINEYQQQLSAYGDIPEGDEGQTLYYDGDGNVVDRSEALKMDFSGISDIDQSIAVAEAQLDFASTYAQHTLDIQEEFGSQFIQQQLDALRESDPIGFQMREEMGRRILDEGFGTNLSDDQRQEVEQSARAAQAARGNIFGAAPAAAEAMQTGDAGYRLQQQRLANAAAFLQGSTPQAQFGQISNAGQGAAPMGSFNLMPGMGPNQNAGAQGAAFGSSVYNTQSQNWATGLNNDPWQSLLGSVTQMGVQGVSNALFSGMGNRGANPTLAVNTTGPGYFNTQGIA